MIKLNKNGVERNEKKKFKYKRPVASEKKNVRPQIELEVRKRNGSNTKEESIVYQSCHCTSERTNAVRKIEH